MEIYARERERGSEIVGSSLQRAQSVIHLVSHSLTFVWCASHVAFFVTFLRFVQNISKEIASFVCLFVAVAVSFVFCIRCYLLLLFLAMMICFFSRYCGVWNVFIHSFIFSSFDVSSKIFSLLLICNFFTFHFVSLLIYINICFYLKLVEIEGGWETERAGECKQYPLKRQ